MQMLHFLSRHRLTLVVVVGLVLFASSLGSGARLPERLFRSNHANSLQPKENEWDRSLIATNTQTGVVQKFVTGAYARTNAQTRNLDQLRKPIFEFESQWRVGDGKWNGELSKKWDEDYYLTRMNALTVVNKQQDLAHSNPAFNSKFTYYLDAKGRPTAALGYVSRSAESNPSGAAAEYCDVLKTAYSGDYNLHNAVGTGVWTKGHIMAATLGGHNTNPLNFFPQRAFDNNGGRYAQGEQVAVQFLTDLKPSYLNVKDCVHVQVTLDYPNVNVVIPSHGTYSVTVRIDCLASAWDFPADIIVAGPNHRMWVTDWSQDETPTTIQTGQIHAKRATPKKRA